jgi:hypothetical protein
MMDQLFSMIRQSSQEVVEQNPDIPNDQNEAVSNVASESIVGSIQNMMSNGGLEGIMSMFSGNGAPDTSHPAMQNVMSDLTGNLTDKLGISSDKASGIAGSIIPMIISKLFSRSGNGGGFDISSLLGNFTGGNGGGFDLGNIASALDVNKDGKTDFSDLTAAIGGGGKAGDGSDDKDGGLLDKLTGLLGK